MRSLVGTRSLGAGQRQRRRTDGKIRAVVRECRGHAVELLEKRVLFNATLTSPIAAMQLAPSSTAAMIDLSTHFNDPTITGTAAIIETDLGNIFVNLFGQQAPVTVSNFMNYANNGAYDQTVLQRAVPGFILQGGGFTTDQNHIPTGAPIANEAGISNTIGTLAMALSSDPTTHQVDPNSATSDWFINDANNTQLDAQKFTVLGQVVYNGMAVVNAIEALPKGAVAPNFEPNVAAGDPSGGVLPLKNYNQGSPIVPTNYVLVSLIRSVLPLSFTATSDNTTLLQTGISGNTLTLTPGAGNGVVHVSVTATDLGGNVAQTTITVQVGSTQATLGTGAARLVRFADPDGTASQISFSGAGTATISFSGTGLTAATKGGVVTVTGTPQAVFINTSGTNATSSMTITGGKGGNGMVDLAGMTTDGPLRAITGRNTALSGNLTAAGAVASLTLASLSNGRISMGAGSSTNVSIGTVKDASVFVTSAINSITAGSWAKGGTISASSIGKLNIKGAFLGNVNSTSSVKSITAGSITGGSMNITGGLASLIVHSITGLTASLGTLGKLSALGAIASSVFRSTGNMGAISAAAFSNSTIFSGVVPNSLPAASTDFNASDTITSVRVKGAFVNTNIAAQSLGALSLGVITAANSGSPFGVAAHQIKSLTGNIGGKTFKLANVTSQSQVATGLAGQGVATQDFTVRIV